MPRRPRERRGDQLLCPKPDGCGEWKHHSRFPVKEKDTTSGVPFKWHRLCKLCHQTEQHKTKNEDRALALVKRRAEKVASKTGTSTSFVMDDLNYRSLVPLVRAFFKWHDECICRSCAHMYDSEPDLQFDHIEPPRHDQDFARRHARNIVLLCGSCNGTKNAMSFADWLDQEEDKRLSVVARQTNTNDQDVLF